MTGTDKWYAMWISRAKNISTEIDGVEITGDRAGKINQVAFFFLLLSLFFRPVSAFGISVGNLLWQRLSGDLIFARIHTVATCQHPSGWRTWEPWKFQSTRKVYRQTFFLKLEAYGRHEDNLGTCGFQWHFIFVHLSHISHIRNIFILVHSIRNRTPNEFFFRWREMF